MNLPDMLAFAFVLPALWLMGKKKKSCFIIFAISSFLLMYVSMQPEEKLWGLFYMQCVYQVFNIVNYIRWSLSETEEEVTRFIP